MHPWRVRRISPDQHIAAPTWHSSHCCGSPEQKADGFMGPQVEGERDAMGESLQYTESVGKTVLKISHPLLSPSKNASAETPVEDHGPRTHTNRLRNEGSSARNTY